MAKIVWDQVGERLYETGVDHGVLYVRGEGGAYPKGVAWNGLTSVNENPTGAEANAQYADNIKYLNLISNEEFEATIEAFTYPVEFEACDGGAEVVSGLTISQQPRKTFGLVYRTLIGNDIDGTEHGYKLHLVYGALAAPSDKDRSTVNETPEAMTFSWSITTTPVEVPGYKPSAKLTVDSTKVDPVGLADLEEALFGTAEDEPYLPLPSEVIELLGGDIDPLP